MLETGFKMHGNEMPTVVFVSFESVIWTTMHYKLNHFMIRIYVDFDFTYLC
jgi:hypothetical protein